MSEAIKVTEKEILDHMLGLGNPERAAHSQGFFKTGKGEYGEGDIFLGIRVPITRQAVKKFKAAPVSVAAKLLKNKYHEVRLFALILLVHHFQRGDDGTQKRIYDLYLKNTRYINNWDLVDSSAHLIVGAWLENRDRKKLYELARSECLWERRIAVIATFWFIRNNEFGDSLKISEILLDDSHDLIHKAVGWMLREVGNRDHEVEVGFLKKHHQEMPRTMLRYAIEKFEEDERQGYLKGSVG